MTNHPIDFVIPWVDGSDPAWQAEKSQYLAPAAAANCDASEIRYRAWDNLRYWFRAVEAYAPWVNRVHFITWGHLPPWLDPAAPKLHIVNHRDYIPPQYLPTFSSHPIELNMHLIPGLSEHFVYFNDDFFLTAPVKPEDFFQKGLPCDSLEESPIYFAQRDPINSITVNDLVFISEQFNRPECRKAHPDKWFNLQDPHGLMKNLIMATLGNYNFFGLNVHHLPQAFRKSALSAVWEADPTLLDATCSHRFRSEADVNQWAVKFWQLLTGQFHPCNKRKQGKCLSAGSQLEEICQIIRQQRYKLLCINDADDMDFLAAQQQVNEAFQAVLPDRSSFER